MDTVFSNSGVGGGLLQDVADTDDFDTYAAQVRALIADSADFDSSVLSPEREENIKYYEGELPGIGGDGDGDYDSLNGDPEVSDEDAGQSTIVSTDVRDTVMTVMPSLMRIFAGSEHAVNYFANTEEQVELANQATDYIRHILWEENDGFTIFHAVLKDALMVKPGGIATWYTDFSKEVREHQFTNVSEADINLLLEEAKDMNPEVVEQGQQVDIDENGSPVYDVVVVKYFESVPKHVVEPVPPEEFRISRRAKSIDKADLVGREQFVRASELIQMGYDPEVVEMFVGADLPYTVDDQYRHPGSDMTNVFNDLVQYGEYYIRIDQDGDGVNELRKICVMGNNYEIVDDFIANDVKFALFNSDPRSHTVIGDVLADLVKDIQKIKTNVLRGSLDSLADVLNPATGVNETLTNMADAMNTDRGRIIRTRGAPSEAIYTIATPFVGAAGFEMMAQMDLVRQSRTGISEASKGVDPKALQSTNIVGIDAIITGAQERIELIARILAETGFKRLYRGLLREVVANPNKGKTLQIRGKWTKINPSLYDPNMRVSVNPQLGKGSDQTRLMALTAIFDAQKQVVSTFGLGNPVVGIRELRATVADMAAISNIKDIGRYFKEVSPEQEKVIEAQPKEPSPELLIAQAEQEKVKKDMVIAIAEDKRAATKQELDEDFRRDKLNIDALTSIAQIVKDIQLAADDVQSEVVPLNQGPN